MIHQSADAPLRLPTESTDKKEVNDDFPALTSDEKPPRTVIECFECDQITPLSGSGTKSIEVVAPMEQESVITTEEFLKEEATDENCSRMGESVKLPRSTFKYDQDGSLFRTSTADGAVQRVAPASIRNRLLHLAHYRILAGHPGGRTMYDTMLG